MGQLEKYGLYVLCLVIFLILGVTIWGGGEVPPGKSPPVSIRAPNGSTPVKANELVSGGARPRAIEDLMDFGGAASPTKNEGGNPKNGNGETAKVDPKADAKKEPKADNKVDPKSEPRVDAKLATYKVQDGDTFESIARTKLGKVSLRDALMRLNPSVEATKLRPGMELRLPSTSEVAAVDAKTKAALEKPVPPAADGARSYVVKKGDNFERIAKAELGSIKRTAELLELNAGLDPTKLKPGTSLKLPPK